MARFCYVCLRTDCVVVRSHGTCPQGGVRELRRLVKAFKPGVASQQPIQTKSLFDWLRTAIVAIAAARTAAGAAKPVAAAASKSFVRLPWLLLSVLNNISTYIFLNTPALLK